MIAFIDDHRAAYGVEPICRVLPIAPSTYHAHAAKRARSGQAIRAGQGAIASLANRHQDGSGKRISRSTGCARSGGSLQREAIGAPRCQVARLMKQHGAG